LLFDYILDYYLFTSEEHTNSWKINIKDTPLLIDYFQHVATIFLGISLRKYLTLPP